MHTQSKQPDPTTDSIRDARDLPGRLAAAQRPARSVAGPASPATLLVVDDNDIARQTFADMLLKQGYDVTCAADAAEAAAWLAQRQFDIMLCDVCMLDQSGTNVLSEVTRQYPEMAVILVTGAGTVQVARDAVDSGATDFIAKPFKPGELAIAIERTLTRRALQRKHAQRFRMALETSYESVLDALLTALNTRDTETEGHSERVTAYTMELADRMGIAAAQLYHIERGALLHDIGKIGIPDRILRKADGLTPDEWMEMRKHPAIGYQMCVNIAWLRPASQIVLHHHEKWNGAGYPDGLRGEAIPLGARIFAVADALDAITSDRPYRKAAPIEAAQREIKLGSGAQFDPSVVELFLAIPEARWAYIRSHAAR